MNNGRQSQPTTMMATSNQENEHKYDHEERPQMTTQPTAATSDATNSVTKQIPPFTYNELDTELKKLKDGRCADTNGAFVEMIKKGGETIRNVLLDLFNEVIKQDQQAPEQWKQNMLTIVFKKGDPKDPGNYRPISVIPILYKILARLLYARLAPQLIGQQCEDQAGFRPHYSTVDHLFVFTCLEEKKP